VVALAGLRRAAVAAPVVGDDAVPPVEEVQHLVVPVIGAQRPAVAEHDRLARTPVLVEDLRAIAGRDSPHRHLLPSVGRGTSATEPSLASNATKSARNRPWLNYGQFLLVGEDHESSARWCAR